MMSSAEWPGSSSRTARQDGVLEAGLDDRTKTFFRPEHAIALGLVGEHVRPELDAVLPAADAALGLAVAHHAVEVEREDRRRAGGLDRGGGARGGRTVRARGETLIGRRESDDAVARLARGATRVEKTALAADIDTTRYESRGSLRRRTRDGDETRRERASASEAPSVRSRFVMPIVILV